MKRAILTVSVLVVSCGWCLAQQGSSGTVNEMSNDPQQNQKLSGSMGSSSGTGYNAGLADHTAEVTGQASSANTNQQSSASSAQGSAGQPDTVPPPGTGMQEKGKPITSSPGAKAATGPTERVEQQRNQKSRTDVNLPSSKRGGSKGKTGEQPKKSQ